MSRSIPWLLIALALCILPACGSAYEQMTAPRDASDTPLAMMREESTGGFAAADLAYAAPEQPPDEARLPDQKQDTRRVIRDSRITLKVDDYTASADAIRTRIEQSGGFVARSELRGETQEKRSGTLVVRFPSEKYEEILAFVQGQGKVFELSENAEDAQDRLVDLEQRLTNARRLEQRILNLLDERAVHIRDVIEAERELAQVRTQIEELDTALLRLRDRVAMATLTIHLFVSGSKDLEARTWYGPLLQDFRDIGFVLAGSLGALLTFLVAAAPWVVLLFLLRRWWRRRRVTQAEPNRRVNKRLSEEE